MIKNKYISLILILTVTFSASAIGGFTTSAFKEPWYSQIILPSFIDVIMAAPSGPGKIVRQLFVDGRGVPNILAIYQI